MSFDSILFQRDIKDTSDEAQSAMIAEKRDSIQDYDNTLLPHYSLWCH